MIGKHLTDERKAEIRAALESGETVTQICKRLGAAKETVRRIRDKAKIAPQPHGVNRNGRSEPVEKPPPHVPLTSRERRDATFWRSRWDEEHRARLDAEHVAEQLAGLRDIPVTIPDWIIAPSAGGGKSVVGCLVSDVHKGEVIKAEEIQGVNAYNPEIASIRLKRYFDAACVVGTRWASDTACQGALLALAGDLVSGDIHEELVMTNALTSHEQVSEVSEDLAGGIKLLRRAYGQVHVVGVPGNHGRTTRKPTAKLYARLSYDIAVCALLARMFRDDPMVTFQFGAATDQVVPVLGRPAFITHGDKMGTRGGMGFAGPNLPIVRGTKKVTEQQVTVTGAAPYLICMGHYHMTSNPGNVLANGSVPGYSEFGRDIRAALEPPQQWLFLMHSKWGLRERAPIQLEPPRPPAKPRVTVPARMAAA